MTLLEAERRKCAFLEQWAPPNARVVWGRAEEQPVDGYGVALAKALAQPATAVEWCLPLVRPGGAVVLWLGPSADLEAVGRVAAQIGGGEPEDNAGLDGDPQAHGDPARLPTPRRRGEEAPLGVADVRGQAP